MAMADVTLHRMSTHHIDDVVALAAEEALPADVMPPDDEADPAIWTPERRTRFAEFLRLRLSDLSDGRSESSFLVQVGNRVVGVARLVAPTDLGEYEIGLWLARSSRGQGTGNHVLRQLMTHARRAGGSALVADTTAGNRAALASLRRHGAKLSPSPRSPDLIDARIDLDG